MPDKKHMVPWRQAFYRKKSMDIGDCGKRMIQRKNIRPLPWGPSAISLEPGFVLGRKRVLDGDA